MYFHTFSGTKCDTFRPSLIACLMKEDDISTWGALNILIDG